MNATTHFKVYHPADLEATMVFSLKTSIKLAREFYAAAQSVPLNEVHWRWCR